MTHEELIHSTLNEINWKSVHTMFSLFQLQWYEEKSPSKRDLVNDLTSLAHNAIANPNLEITTEHWSVIFLKTKENEELHIAFTPIIVHFNSSLSFVTQDRADQLKKRIQLHEDLEQYEKCEKIYKQLNKLQNKTNKI